MNRYRLCTLPCFLKYHMALRFNLSVPGKGPSAPEVSGLLIPALGTVAPWEVAYCP